MKRIAIAEMPSHARIHFEGMMQNSVMPLLSGLHMMLFDQLEFDKYDIQFRQEESQTYKNDGNTPAAATTYSTLWVIPLWREKSENNEWHSWSNGTGHSAIYIHASVQFRNSDNKQTWHDNSSLSFAPVIPDPGKTSSLERLCYTTRGSSFGMTEAVFVRLAWLVDQAQRDHNLDVYARRIWGAVQSAGNTSAKKMIQ